MMFLLQSRGKGAAPDLACGSPRGRRESATAERTTATTKARAVTHWASARFGNWRQESGPREGGLDAVLGLREPGLRPGTDKLLSTEQSGPRPGLWESTKVLPWLQGPECSLPWDECL